MLRRVHSIILLLALLVGGVGMHYVQAAKYVITVRSNPATAGKVQVGSYTATTSQSYQYPSPTTVTVKAIPNTGYKFVNWSNGSTSTASSISVNLANNNGKTYVANFAIKTYTITFKNADGTTLQTLTVNHGATPSYSGSTPTKASTAQYSYTFKGWDKAIAAATADAVYTATYTATTRSYTIKFVNNGTTLQTSTLQYGATPSYTGATPTKTATAQYTYTFSGWSPTIVAATANATYTAQFSAGYC